jgi:hypothetical protein
VVKQNRLSPYPAIARHRARHNQPIKLNMNSLLGFSHLLHTPSGLAINMILIHQALILKQPGQMYQ